MVDNVLYKKILWCHQVTCRAPHFSLWLCRQKRKYEFQYIHMAMYLNVSPQCIDSYSNGRAHPQIMKFVKIIEFIEKYRSDDFQTILLEAINHIKQDKNEHEKKIQ